jgi:hypothetical protein
MPHYPVVNLETGEKQELHMSMTEYTQWREDNPGWDKDWMAGVGGGGVECVGEWKTRTANKHPGWKHVLDKAAKLAPQNKSQLY